jgi:methylmalonyl-CoA/ethylmalonyl-CoA epimerase
MSVNALLAGRLPAEIVELNLFGNDAVFDHIGLAVKSIRESVGEGPEIFADEVQKVSVAFVVLNGVRIELIEPLGDKTPITSSLEGGHRLVHLCFRVPDIQAAIKKARENGFHCIARPVPAKAFNNKRIAWLFCKIYGLVELLEA